MGEEIWKLLKRAEEGDLSAMFDLHMHYGCVGTEDQVKADYWKQRAADSGCGICCQWMAIDCEDAGDWPGATKWMHCAIVAKNMEVMEEWPDFVERCRQHGYEPQEPPGLQKFLQANIILGWSYLMYYANGDTECGGCRIAFPLSKDMKSE